MSNPSGIFPTEYNVLVRPKAVEEVTKGGVIIPPTAKEKEEFATTEGNVIALSPLAFSFDDWPKDAQKPKQGDVVLYTRYAGTVVKGNDGIDYRIVKDRDIAAIKQ